MPLKPRSKSMSSQLIAINLLHAAHTDCNLYAGIKDVEGAKNVEEPLDSAIEP